MDFKSVTSPAMVSGLREAIAAMDLPELRASVRDMADVRWLSRNIGCKAINVEHPNFQRANALIRGIIRAEMEPHCI